MVVVEPKEEVVEGASPTLPNAHTATELVYMRLGNEIVFAGLRFDAASVIKDINKWWGLSVATTNISHYLIKRVSHLNLVVSVGSKNIHVLMRVLYWVLGMGQRATTLDIHLDSLQQEGGSPSRANLDLHTTNNDDVPIAHSENPQPDGIDIPKFVVDMELRNAPADEPDDWIRSYGIICCGAETMRAAWPKLEHKFSIGPSVVHQYGP